MRRASLLAALACMVAVGGCMKIYPDPELPDVEVEWFADDCEGLGDVSLVLISLDSDTRIEATASCAAGEYAFADVKRERYRVEGTLVDTSGEIYAGSEYDVDLRNGYDQTAYLYFGGGSNYRVSWVFDMGASCESLNALGMAIDLLPDGYSTTTFCDDTPYFGYTINGTYTVRLRAVTENGDTVAVSPESPPVTLGFGLVDLGTFTLTPCSPECPE